MVNARLFVRESGEEGEETIEIHDKTSDDSWTLPQKSGWVKLVYRSQLVRRRFGARPCRHIAGAQGEFPPFWLTKPFESREHTSAKR
jgi:hypothetical protein